MCAVPRKREVTDFRVVTLNGMHRITLLSHDFDRIDQLIYDLCPSFYIHKQEQEQNMGTARPVDS